MDENQQLSSILFQLDSFCQYRKICQEKLLIEAEYSKFGELTEIKNPIMN